MKYRLLFTLVALASAPVALSQGPDAQTPAPRVRFDGIYALVLDSPAPAERPPRNIVLRLYEDGTAVSDDYKGALTDCAKWLDRDNEKLFPGTWSLNGSQFSMVVYTGLSGKSLTGTLTGQGLQTEAGPQGRIYRFVPIAFEAPSPSMPHNRRPFFRGHSTVVRKLDYDLAGNLTGIRDDYEVQVSDPDGDQLSYTWVTTSGEVTGGGAKIVWHRVVIDGQCELGFITLIVSDDKGGSLIETLNIKSSFAQP
jgi:hypothetical protein